MRKKGTKTFRQNSSAVECICSLHDVVAYDCQKNETYNVLPLNQTFLLLIYKIEIYKLLLLNHLQCFVFMRTFVAQTILGLHVVIILMEAIWLSQLHFMQLFFDIAQLQVVSQPIRICIGSMHPNSITITTLI
uniref:Uncharacterized protein n=1 Tax=Glossina brevipalpis TaxID=37001 RepID=A0A1A9W159_9MUSC